MNAATYTKIVKSEMYNDTSMSIGFRRYACLPAKVKSALNIAVFFETGSTDTHSAVVSFFSKMTESEYKEYVITH